MLRSSRRLGQLLIKRTSTSAVSSGPTDPTAVAVFQFMGEVTKSNAEERRRVDEKFDRSFVKFSSSLESVSISQNSLKSDVSSLKEDVSSLAEAQDSLIADVSSLTETQNKL